MKGMHLHQFDIRTAFLNGDLIEELYMCQLQWYVDPYVAAD